MREGKARRTKSPLSNMHQDTVMDEHSVLAAFSQTATLALHCALLQATVRDLHRASSGWLKVY
jgi:hypothetical protein